MVDGGWVPKRFSDFPQILFIVSLNKIKMSYFRNFAKNFFYRKKIQLQVSKSGVFCEKKCSANLLKLQS